MNVKIRIFYALQLQCFYTKQKKNSGIFSMSHEKSITLKLSRVNIKRQETSRMLYRNYLNKVHAAKNKPKQNNFMMSHNYDHAHL